MSNIDEVKEAIELLRKALDHPGSLDWKGGRSPWRNEVTELWRDAARRWVRMVSEFPSGEDVQMTVASMPRWMLEAIREHVGVPEDVVSVILVAAVGVEKETE